VSHQPYANVNGAKKKQERNRQYDDSLYEGTAAYAGSVVMGHTTFSLARTFEQHFGVSSSSDGAEPSDYSGF
jgi:hypothetical protein